MRGNFVIFMKRGIAIITMLKGGVVYSLRMGSGIVVSRLPDGWSAPSAIGVGGMGIGGQIGGEVADFVFILNTEDAVKAFSHGGNVTLGGNLSIAAGPVGRSAEAIGTARDLAAVYCYAKSKGLFVGISVEGTLLIERKEANSGLYGPGVRADMILNGYIPRPSCASGLYDALSSRIHRRDIVSETLAQ
jgi:lipid-binding SYLF domain-containing protein